MPKVATESEGASSSFTDAVDVEALERLAASAPEWNGAAFYRAFGHEGDVAARILAAFPSLLAEVRRLREENDVADAATTEVLGRINDLHNAIFGVPNGISFHTHEQAVAAANALRSSLDSASAEVLRWAGRRKQK